MKHIHKLLPTLVLFFFISGFSQAQNITFSLADPHPDLPMADVGDMEFADLDMDGDNDLIIIGKGGPILTTIYFNDGNGGFTERENPDLIDVFSGNIGVNDVDKDGDLDLLITGTSLSVPSVNLYLNDGTGTFNQVATNIAPTAGGDLAFGDIDNDDDDDLIISGFSEPSGNDNATITKVYLSDGTGNFTEQPEPDFIQLASRITLFDCDGDDDLDLLVSGSSNSIDQQTILYLNDGTGNFSESAPTSITDLSGGDLATGDADGDGDTDVLICGQGEAGEISTELYLNDGAGVFTIQENSPFSNVSIGEVSFNDFDADGDLDVFLIGSGPGGLSDNSIVANVYENTGEGTFIVSDSLIGGYLSSHAVADIDGDNDLDLVLGGTTIAQPVRATWLYINESDGAVSQDSPSSTAAELVEVYPNPFTGIVNIQLPKADEALVKVYAVTGTLLTTRSTNTDNIQLNLPYPPGQYLLHVTTSEYQFTRKVISVR